MPISLITTITTSYHTQYHAIKKTPILLLSALVLGSTSYAHADSMSALISQKSAQAELSVQSAPSAPSARISSQTRVQRSSTNFDNKTATPTINTYSSQPSANITNNNSYRYPEIKRQASTVLPAFLSGSYDNVDSEYLPLLSIAESHSSHAAREVISTARTMALNERTIVQGGCWDYLNAVFKRAGVTRDTIHKGAYRQGPYADSSAIEIGDWLYYINHGYRGVEHSGLFVGWVDETSKQALILSYAGENRREPARYRVYDLSNVYQIMRPTI